MTLGKTKLSTLEKMVESIKKTSDTVDPDLTFEILVGSLYPTVFHNTQQALKDMRTEGYIDAALHNLDEIKDKVTLRGWENYFASIERQLEKLEELITELSESIDETMLSILPVELDGQLLFVRLMLSRIKELYLLCEIAKGDKDENQT